MILILIAHYIGLSTITHIDHPVNFSYLSPTISGCLLKIFDATSINTTEDLIAHYIGLSTVNLLQRRKEDGNNLIAHYIGLSTNLYNLLYCTLNITYRPLYRAVYNKTIKVFDVDDTYRPLYRAVYVYQSFH